MERRPLDHLVEPPPAAAVFKFYRDQPLVPSGQAKTKVSGSPMRLLPGYFLQRAALSELLGFINRVSTLLANNSISSKNNASPLPRTIAVKGRRIWVSRTIRA